MPSNSVDGLLCYNKGCGNRFDPNANTEDSCQYHPGAPIFHDAYKSWSCCKKKSTDFTEFLNTKGCTRGKHNPEKPAEPERRKVDKSTDDEMLEVKPRPPVAKPLERPADNVPRVKIEAEIAPSLQELMKNLKLNQKDKVETEKSGVVPIGTACKNGGCKQFYQGNEDDQSVCEHHPGTPVFHEGLKYWSCCKRKTTDFDVFLSQKGCTEGEHLWLKSESSAKNKDLRIDWHQTPSTVTVAIYAKNYDPNVTCVYLTPVRMDLDVFFPADDFTYKKEIELGGVISVPKSTAKFLPSKIEVTLVKAQIGGWPDLYYHGSKKKAAPQKEETPEKEPSNVTSTDDDIVDLSDL
nr:PREDICTED: cysteine and histidine-rich domain-containing protein 1 [Bemisia tabaci]